MIEPLLDPDCQFEWRDGVKLLVNRRFGDMYFSAENGLAESRQVFIDGCALPDRLPQKPHFTVAESGFGTGLNFLATMQVLDSLGEHAPYLHYIATEHAPLDGGIIAEALADFPELGQRRDALINTLPPRWAGRHRRFFMGGQVTLDLLYGDSLAMLKASHFRADAWYLDGFAPARNPSAWSGELCRRIASLSADGARLGSFTAAGAVRRGLEAAGFSIERHKGFGRKKHRITGLLTRSTPPVSPKTKAKKIIIIGAGIAGASVAYALLRQGAQPLVVDSADSVASGASGNSIAMQSPRLTAGDSVAARLSLTAWGFARYLAREAGAVEAEGSVILAHNDAESLRQQKIIAQNWPPHLLTPVSASEAKNLTGIDMGFSGCFYPYAGTVNPKKWVEVLLKNCPVHLGVQIRAIENRGDGVAIIHDDGVFTAEAVVLANGSGLPSLVGEWLPENKNLFQITAGQVSHLSASALPLTMPMSFGGYMARGGEGGDIARGGHTVPHIAIGASFDHHDPKKPIPKVSRAGHAKNLSLLPEQVRNLIDADKIEGGRVSLRLATPDRQPLAGQLAEGVFILAALGARGMVTAPILGEYIASLLLNTPSPLDCTMADHINPHRFTKNKKR